MSRAKLATMWLDGCSGCHMSLLDLDEGLLALAARVDLVYSPLVDATAFPEDVDVALVEGAVATAEDVVRLRTARERSRVLVALGDCATTGNVPALRNMVPLDRLLERVYVEGANTNPGIPHEGVPELAAQARPLHDFVKIDVHLPGCPPPPGIILAALQDLLEKRVPKLADVKFG